MEVWSGNVDLIRLSLTEPRSGLGPAGFDPGSPRHGAACGIFVGLHLVVERQGQKVSRADINLPAMQVLMFFPSAGAAPYLKSINNDLGFSHDKDNAHSRPAGRISGEEMGSPQAGC